MRKTKAKLIMTLSIALLSVFTMGVSTFAWFQAQAEVNIRTESTSTTITVAKPDSFTLFAFKGNTNPYHVIDTENYDFDSDFTEVDPNNLDDETKFDGTNANNFHPGDVKCFALYFSNHVSTDTISLKIKELTSETMYKASNSTKHRKAHTTSVATNYEVNVGWSVDIYSTLVTAVTNKKPTNVSSYSTFATSPTGKLTAEGVDGQDMFQLAIGSNNLGTGYNGSSEGQTVTLNPSTCQLTTNHNLNVYMQPNTISASEGFIFFTIVFRDEPAFRYAEVTSSSDTPILDSLDANDYDADNRYFLKNVSNVNHALYNSNCFAGLTFNISLMEFKF